MYRLIFYLDDNSAAVGYYRIEIILKDDAYEVFYFLDIIIEENSAPYFEYS